MNPKHDSAESARHQVPDAYEAPALLVLGSVEAITLSKKLGSVSDFRGRRNRRRTF